MTSSIAQEIIDFESTIKIMVQTGMWIEFGLVQISYQVSFLLESRWIHLEISSDEKFASHVATFGCRYVECSSSSTSCSFEIWVYSNNGARVR